MRNKLKINKLIIKELYFEGYNHIADKYWEIRPKEICLKCLEYRHTSYKGYSKTPKCYIYTGDYKVKDYKCFIISYLILIKKVCIYLFIKYVYCKDSYFTISNNCTKKRVAIKEVKKKI